MTDDKTTDKTRVTSPPNFFAGLSEDSTEEEIEAAAADHDDWLSSEPGQTFLEWDRKVCECANVRGVSSSEAMEILNVEFV